MGRLLGPKGLTLKRMQAETQTKMSILGRGSMRDRQKEEELRGGDDPSYAHLKEDLHVLIEAVGPHSTLKVAAGLAEIRKMLIPPVSYTMSFLFRLHYETVTCLTSCFHNWPLPVLPSMLPYRLPYLFSCLFPLASIFPHFAYHLPSLIFLLPFPPRSLVNQTLLLESTTNLACQVLTGFLAVLNHKAMGLP